MWRDSETTEDFLNFTEVADQIAALVTNASLLPISIGVFGGWGTGKSTVLQLAERALLAGASDRPILVHFDAWLYQGFDDARAALMEVISADLIGLAESKRTLVDKAKDFAGRINYFRGLGLIADFGVGMALGIPPGLLTHAGAALSSLASGAGVSEKEADAVKGDVSASRKDLADLVRPAKKRTPPQEIKAFRKEFSDLLEGLDTTLIVFIDNLDRCLPDVAIGTLEAIRLFLFMPRTAFVIAADEDMIRHSVAKHFGDPNARHVRDYLDKVIQVPLRVPQVGHDDLRAYMYSLFVARAAPDKLPDVQKHLLASLQRGWTGETFTKEEIADLAGNPKDLLDALSVADRLAPILATAPNVQGNPRIVKRLLNAISLRQVLAANRKMAVNLATLAKLALFERCTDGPATLALYRLVMEGQDADPLLVPSSTVKGAAVPEPPPDWAAHKDFLDQWRAMEPIFDDIAALRPAVFLSRDVMAPALSRAGLSEAAMLALEALLRVDSVNSPAGAALVDELTASDRRAVMSSLVEAMRDADWSGVVKGVHGAIILARASPGAAAEFTSFLGTLPPGRMHKGMGYLLKNAGFLAAA